MPKTLTGFTPATPEPLVTFYDLATGERVELSGITMANWVAKVSNFLVDDLDAEPGTRIRIGLPSHWLRFVWLLAAWNVGANVVDNDAEIGLSGPELEADEPIRLASALAPMGMRFSEAPAGFTDIALEVPNHSDHYDPWNIPTGDDTAWDLDGVSVTHSEAIESAGAGSPVRVLRGRESVRSDAAAIISAIVGGGSLVVAVNADDDELQRVAEQENAQLG